MISFLFKFWKPLLGAFIILSLVTYAASWHYSAVKEGYERGRFDERAELIARTQAHEQTLRNIITQQAKELQEKKIETKIKYVPVERKLTEYITLLPSKETCDANDKYINPRMLFEPKFVELLDIIAAGHLSPSDAGAEPTGDLSGRTAKAK